MMYSVLHSTLVFNVRNSIKRIIPGNFLLIYYCLLFSKYVFHLIRFNFNTFLIVNLCSIIALIRLPPVCYHFLRLDRRIWRHEDTTNYLILTTSHYNVFTWSLNY